MPEDVISFTATVCALSRGPPVTPGVQYILRLAYNFGHVPNSVVSINGVSVKWMVYTRRSY